MVGCGVTEEQDSEAEYKQAYYDCYYDSQEYFKKISRVDYVDLKLEKECNDKSSFLDNPQDEVCLKACIDAFNHYK